jgi:Tfp pilus assembly protein PilV
MNPRRIGWRRDPAPTRRHRGDPSERGDTLIEIIIALVVIAIGVVALISALTTSITTSATYRSLSTVDTVLKNFADAMKDQIQLATPATASIYANCATTYQVVTEYPTSTTAGGSVTVLATGLLPSHAVTATVNGVTMPPATSDTNGSVVDTFTLPVTWLPGSQPVTLTDGTTTITSTTPLTVNPSLSAMTPVSGPAGTPVTLTAGGFQHSTALTVSVGGSAPVPVGTTDVNGAATVSFTVPGSLPTGAQTVTVSDGTYSSSSTFVVASSVGSAGPVFAAPASAIANYSIKISSIGWWNKATSQFDVAPTPCGANDDTGIQSITIQTSAPNHVSDTLSFVVTDPLFRPTLSVTSPLTTSPGQPLTFSATLTGQNKNGNAVPPTGTISWSFSSPAGMTNPCSTPSTVSGLTNPQTGFQCQVSAPATGIYQVTATYSGDANYGSAVDFGSATVGDASTVTVSSSPANPASPSMLTLNATVTGPAGGPTPSGQIMWTFSSPYGASGTLPSCNPSNLAGSGNSATTAPLASCIINPTQSGTYQVTAAYSGDQNYTSETEQPVSVVVS